MIYYQYLIKVGGKKKEDRKVLYKLLLTRAKNKYKRAVKNWTYFLKSVYFNNHSYKQIIK